MSLINKTVIVTGCAGFIGSNYTNKFLEYGGNVIGIDCINDYYDQNIKQNRIKKLISIYKDRFTFFQVDLTNKHEIFNIFNITINNNNISILAVLHFAAQAGVSYAEKYPEITRKNNIEATIILQDICAQFCKSIKHVIFASSSMVYTNSFNISNSNNNIETIQPFKESTICIPIGNYALSKFDMENRFCNYAKQGFYNVTIARLFSVYGVNGRPDMAPIKFLQQIYKYEPCIIYGNGTQTRDFTYIDDVVQSLILLTQLTDKTVYSETKTFHIVNIGRGESYSIVELAHIIANKLNRPLYMRFQQQYNTATVEPHITCADTRQLQSLIGYKPSTNLADGVDNMIKWFFQTNPTCVITIIATLSSRTELLCSRCLPSILHQLTLPDFVVIVLDSNSIVELTELTTRINKFVEDTPLQHRVFIIDNIRTNGASGAWNSGIEFIVHSFMNKDKNAIDLLQFPSSYDLSNIFIAIIDDDDSWQPNHISICKEAIINKGSDMVFCGLIRHTSSSNEIQYQSIPNNIKVCDFLLGNPHIQGSNMFIRIDILLYAGLFDENLKSCTDRDLMIRILDLNYGNIQFINQHTVNHYAESDRLRLSSPGSLNKLQGLTQFWLKYNHRMDLHQQQAFINRANTLFQWTVPSLNKEESITTTCKASKFTDHDVAAIIGIDIDTPPLPEPFIVRTQLVDLYGLLKAVTNCTPNGQFCNKSQEVSNNNDDIYHDLSNNTLYLETPLYTTLLPQSNQMKVSNIINKISLELSKILNGSLVFRNINTSCSNSFIESYFRGGFTFIFDFNSILDVANVSPTLNGLTIRRSDMNWCLINKQKYNRKIYLDTSLKIHHHRYDNSSINNWNNNKIEETRENYCIKVMADIQGHAVTRAIEGSKIFIHNSNIEEQFEIFWNSYKEFLLKRVTRFMLSLYRITGLIKVIQLTVQQLQHNWSESKSDNILLSLSSINQVLTILNSLYDIRWWTNNCIDKLITSTHQDSGTMFVKPQLKLWLDTVLTNCSYHTDDVIPIISRVYLDQCINMARYTIQRLTNIHANNLQLLAIGSEGVSFVNNNNVYKSFHMYPIRFNSYNKMQDHITYLQSLITISGTSNVIHLALPTEIHYCYKTNDLVIIKPFIAGELFTCENITKLNCSNIIGEQCLEYN